VSTASKATRSQAAATSSASASASTTAGAASVGDYSHRQIMTILSALLMGMFLAALDQTVVSTAIRTIGDDLHGLQAQAWVTTAFLITSTIATPLYGKLSDIYGRKRFFMLAITLFVIGSALCGISTSMYELAAFRAFQGLGAGGLFSLALAIIADIIPPRERAKYQGYMMAVFASSSVLGPIVGGYLASQSSIVGLAGWRWIFWINVPLGIIALGLVMRNLHLRHRSVPQRIDWWGAVLLTVGLVPLLIVAEQGREWGWGSALAVASYVVGVGALTAFCVVEARLGPVALIPFRLFRLATFRVGSILSFILGIGMFGAILTLPLYLQLVKGASPTKSGLLMLPLVLGLMGASLVAGQVTARTGRYRWLPVAGTAIMVVGLVLLHSVSADTPLVFTDLFMLTFGIGLGLCMQTVILAMQNAVPASDIGVATSSATFFRQVGGTMGTAVFLSILFSSVGKKVNVAYQNAFAGRDSKFGQAVADPSSLHPADRDFIAALKGGQTAVIDINDTSFLKNLSAGVAHPFQVGFSQAMDTVFLFGAGVLLIGFLVSLLLKEVPLRTQSGQQAAQSEAESEAEAAANAVPGPH
jgi:EmrB/QacA subfamily drug resistance transporter